MKFLKDNKRLIGVVMVIVFVVGVISVIYVGKVGKSELAVWSFGDEFGGSSGGDESVVSSSGLDSAGSDGNTGSSAGDESAKNVENVDKNENSTDGVGQIYVHIIGEVKNEGIVILNKGERVIDAIEKAGGVTESADLSKINLAYKLSDGQKIKIPNVNEPVKEEANYVYGLGSNEKEVKNSKVNINTATQTELETLNGIGPSLASKIIEYRKKNGSFKKIEEVKNVSGIGGDKYNLIKEEIEV